MKDYKRLTRQSVGDFKYCLKDHKAKTGEFNDYDAFFDYSMAVKRLGELEDKIERGELVEVPKGAVVLTPEERDEEMRLCNEERKQLEHRAEVAERALLTACINLIKDEEDNVNMELLAHVVYTKFLRKAEKELAEGKKDE